MPPASTACKSWRGGESGPFARPLRGAVECRGDVVEIVVEEVRIDVERHGCGGVVQHALNRLHVRAGLHRERRGRVAKVMNGHERQFCDAQRGLEPGL